MKKKEQVILEYLVLTAMIVLILWGFFALAVGSKDKEGKKGMRGSYNQWKDRVLQKTHTTEGEES